MKSLPIVNVEEGKPELAPPRNTRGTALGNIIRTTIPEE